MRKFLEDAKKFFEQLWDDIIWEIAMFLKYGPETDGIFASLIVPVFVAFITTILTLVLLHTAK